MKLKNLRKWALLLAAAAGLGGAVAYAQRAECWDCTPCGCAADGGYILCCSVTAC